MSGKESHNKTPSSNQAGERGLARSSQLLLVEPKLNGKVGTGDVHPYVGYNAQPHHRHPPPPYMPSIQSPQI